MRDRSFGRNRISDIFDGRRLKEERRRSFGG